MPQGTTPRSLVVHLKGGLTRSCKPGDAVSLSGAFLPEPYTGFKAMKAGLLTATFLDAMVVTQLKQSYQQHALDHELQQRMMVSPASIISLELIILSHSACLQSVLKYMSNLARLPEEKGTQSRDICST